MTLQDIDRVCSDNVDLPLEFPLTSDRSKKMKFTGNELDPVTYDSQDGSKKPVRSDATYLTHIKDCLKLGDKSGAESIMKYAKDDVQTVQLSRISQINPAKCFDTWDKMSVIEREKKVYDLESENKDVCATYSSLIYELCFSFMNRGVQPISVQMVVLNYGCVIELSKDDNMLTVFLALSKRSSWFNFELFSLLVKVIGNQEEKDLFQQYQQETLIPYLQRCIFEIPPHSFGPSNGQLQPASLFFKVVDDILLTGIDVKTTQRNLAKLLEIDHSAFLFEFYKAGCFELFFNVSVVSYNLLHSHYLSWDPSRESYKVNADLVTVL